MFQTGLNNQIDILVEIFAKYTVAFVCQLLKLLAGFLFTLLCPYRSESCLLFVVALIDGFHFPPVQNEANNAMSLMEAGPGPMGGM
jgi:hypothetical protein